MLSRMPLSLFNRWAAYLRVEPRGEDRADLRAAIVACTMANAWRGKNQRAFRVEDFMPDFDKTSREQSPEEMQAILGMVAQTANAVAKGK